MNRTSRVTSSIAGILFVILFTSVSRAADPNDPNDPNGIVATPVFNPDGGIYSTPQNVVITCATAGATIRYTMNGSDPNEGTIIENGGSVLVSVNPPTTLKARAFKEGWLASNIKTATYSIKYGGAGTSEDPFRIANKTDLLTLAATVADYGKCFILTADIDLNGQVFTTAIIAPNTSTTFTGTFDGNGHKITHFTINGGFGFCLGLFGYTGSNSVIKNLGIENFSVFGTANSSHVGGRFISGLAGYNLGSISNCYSIGTVSGYENVGGLAGFSDGSINNCHSAGSVSGYSSVGGLIGCAYGSISNCHSDSIISAVGKVGGLIGFTVNSNISNCYATGAVTGLPKGYDTGGLIGLKQGSVNNCYATGTVSGYKEVGGLVGNNLSGNIRNCYSTGSVSGSSYVGGFIGYKEIGTCTNCFWDTQTSGWTTSYGGTGKTTAQMKTLSTFTSAGWDFSEADGDLADWFFPTPADYPVLFWEAVPFDTNTVASPMFSVAGGTYNSEKTVWITCATSGATIHYTTTGIEPTESDPAIASGSSVTVDRTMNLKARAWNGAMTPSRIISATYQIIVATPVFTPDGGTYNTEQTVTITCATPGTTIRYTLDGSDPNEGTVYDPNIPLVIDHNLTLKARAWKGAMAPSSIKSANYQFIVATPVFTPAGGTYNTEQTVTISCATPQATIRYTLDGSDPNTGAVYEPNSVILIDHTLTLKAKAWKDGFDPSSVKSASYQCIVATPAFTPDGGNYTEDQTVTITCATPGATIRYTTDGSDPNLGGTIIDNGGSVTISVNPATTLKAFAWKGMFQSSSIKAALYRKPGLIYVNAAATGTNTGANWTNAFTSLQSALSAAVSGDEIWVAAGTYHPTSDYGVSHEGVHFRLKNNVGLYGGFHGTESSREQRNPDLNETILSGDLGAGNLAAHIFYHPYGTNLDNTAILDGFTIRDSYSYSTDLDYDAPTAGGGMYNYNSSPTIRNCIFSHNTVFDERGADPTYCYSFGHGMANIESNPLLINCVFRNHSIKYQGWAVGGYGGIIYNADSSPTLINCVFVDNYLVDGDYRAYLVWNEVYSSPVLTNCIMTRNEGYGILNFNSNPVVTNCTMFSTKNHTLIENIWDSYPVITNCILWGTSAPIHDYYSNGSIVTYSDIQGGYSGTGNINADPLFANDANDVRLQTGSPCLDAGNNAAVPSGITTDLAGNPRFVDDPDKTDTGLGTPPLVDMGAYEGRTISTPVFTPGGGTYNTEQDVIITCATPGATIHYTTNGVDPTENDPVIASGSSVHIDHSLFLKARAFKTDWNPSAVKTVLYCLYAGGNGSSQYPYQINTREDLLGLAADPNQYYKCFILTNDIDLNGQAFTGAIIAPDTSLYYDFQGTSFTGTFDGNNHKITHFTIHGNGYNYLGLFGHIGPSGQIKNLGIKHFSVSDIFASAYIGGLIGYNYGSISNCYSTGAVSETRYLTNPDGGSGIGGLVGYHYSGSISNCYSTGTVSGMNSAVGGMVGYHRSGSISNCYSTGAVSGSSYAVGGFIGYNNSGIVSNCYSTGPISSSYSRGGFIGGNYSGAVTGSFWDTQTSGQTTSAGGTGKTTAEMKMLSTFTSAGWDFNPWVPGKTGNALSFDGINDYVQISGYKGITGQQPRTVSAWIRTTESGRYIVSWGSSVAGRKWIISLNSNSSLGVVGALRVETEGDRVIGTRNLCDGAWHHIAVTWEPDESPYIGDAMLYVDGVLEISAASGSSYPLDTAAAYDVVIGSYLDYPSYFNGTVDEVRIYDCALSAGEIVPLSLPESGLVTHWAMDETTGTVAHDSVSSYDGQLSNTSTWAICEGTNYPRLQWQIPETDWVCPDGVYLEDLDYFVGKWLETNCDSSNEYCDGVDTDASGKIDLEDWAIFAVQWLQDI